MNTDGHELCLACGACCDGVWFSNINLQPGEEAQARRAGMTIEIVDRSAHAPQPCPLHQNGCCSAYDQWRPAACVTYRCKLLIDVTEGRVPMAEALEHVRAAKAMAERIRKEMPGLPAGMLGTQFLKRLSGESAADAPPEIPATARLDGVALNMYYRKYFRVPGADGVPDPELPQTTPSAR